MQTLTVTRISLETGCEEACVALAFPLYRQLSRGNYRHCSVLPVPDSLEEWRLEHRTARKRADHAERLGYRHSLVERERYLEDIYAVNVSLPVRQGRPMAEGYRERPAYRPLPAYACLRHAIRQNAVLSPSGRLVAYLWMYRMGELALVSQILGHAEHLRSDVMYLLFQGALEQELREGGQVVYNRHDSGTEGLRFFKERLGFREREVAWQL